MKYLFAVLLAILFLPSVVFAQTLAPDLTIDMVPSNPQPGQSVMLTARSYGVDINQASLSWTYNGVSVGQGTGKKSIQITAPAAGATGTATVTMGGIGTDTATATIILRPGSIDLLWEAADAYTPPFYKGKALLPVGGLIRVTAIPGASAPKNLSFNWTRNGSVVETLSGFGKSSMLIKHDMFSPQEKIGVDVATGTFGGTNTLVLSPFAPLAIAYEKSDGFINYSRGFDQTVVLSKPGTVLHFEPYYFSVPSLIAQDLSTQITANGETLPTMQPNEIALSRPDNGGQSTLKLAVTTVAYSLQHLEKTFTLLFN